MSGLARSVVLLGLVVPAGGLVTVAVGVVWEHTDDCQSGYDIAIEQTGPNETVDAERVAYENLSATQQRVFRETVTSESPPRYQNVTVLQELTGRALSYRGELYETGPVYAVDCGSGWAIFQLFGGLGAIVGGVIAGVAAVWRRLR